MRAGAGRLRGAPAFQRTSLCNGFCAGHNGTNRLYMAYKLGMPLSNYRRLFQENSAITLFELDDNGQFTLKKLNA